MQTRCAMLQITHALNSLRQSVAAESATEEQSRLGMSDMDLSDSASVSVLADVTFMHLYISDMKYFSSLNSEYCKWFGKNPPSRKCIAVALPEGVHVAAEATFLLGSHSQIKLGRSFRRQVYMSVYMSVLELLVLSQSSLSPFTQFTNSFIHTQAYTCTNTSTTTQIHVVNALWILKTIDVF